MKKITITKLNTPFFKDKAYAVKLRKLLGGEIEWIAIEGDLKELRDLLNKVLKIKELK